MDITNDEKSSSSVLMSPFIVDTRAPTSWSHWSFKITGSYYGKNVLYLRIYKHNSSSAHDLQRHLTIIPSHLQDAGATLLVTDKKHSNLRVLFTKGHATPEVMHLSMTWDELMLEFPPEDSLEWDPKESPRSSPESSPESDSESGLESESELRLD